MRSATSRLATALLGRALCVAWVVAVLGGLGGLGACSDSGTSTASTPAAVTTTLAPMLDSFGDQVAEASFGGGDAGASGGDGSAGDGAPIPNAPVRITDVTGKTATTTTDANGYYRVRIDGFKPPYIASVTRADGTVWFSPSADPVKVRGFITINISGLTDKIVSDVAISAGLVGADRMTPTLLAANLAAIETAKRKLATDISVQILKAGLDPATFDPVRVAFRTDRTGYDAVLDNVDVSKLTGGPTVINPLYAIEGGISGLGNGSGLVLSNGSDTLNIAAGSTTFKFTNLQSTGASYRVAVNTQPSGVSCLVNNGLGTVASAPVTNISIACSNLTYTLGGTVSGRGTSGTLTLSTGSQTVSIPAGASSFVFPTALPQGGAFSVAVQAQPAGLTCSVANNAGTVATANVGNVSVACSAITNTLGGTVSGLVANGLILASGGQSLPVFSGQSSFTFAAPVAAGSSYSVTLQANPVGYTCTLSNNTGVMASTAVTSVSVVCIINNFSLGGSVSGLSTTGLVLASNGQTLPVSSGSSSFAFASALAFGTSYNVTVQTQPSGMTCTVNNGSGVMANAATSNVAISCNAATFALGGTISGLSSSGLVLSAGGQFVSPASGATSFALPNPLAFGSGYTVAVQTQPAGNTCSVSSNATGTIAGTVSNVGVVCSLPSYSIGGTVSGFTVGSGLVLANGGQTVNISPATAPYTFPIALNLGTSYNVSVQTQPSGYSCTVSNGTGTVGSAAVTNINISCAVVGAAVSTVAGPLGMTISGMISGPDDSIYWTHARSHSVYKRSPAGVITLIGGSAVSSFLPGGYVDGTIAASRFDSPKGIAIDSAGNLFVGDSGNSVIRKFTASTQLWSTFAGTAGSPGFADGSRSPGFTTPVGTFTAPASLAIDASDNVYVGSSGLCSCIRVIPPSGDQVSTVTTDLGTGVVEVATNVTGFITVTSTTGFAYPITLATGVSLTGFGDNRPGVKFFDGSLASDSSGNTWAVSATFESVWRVHTGISPPLGSLVSYGSQNTGYLDGPANLATFTAPYAVTINPSGHVLIGDGEFIRKLIP